ncbi:acylneuraminate cytidylyltransferase family protein, partial [bacterium]|nr:acylneuraminate cytidylyltransferase family protein [bacterium]
MLAVILARKGSKRIPEKNIRELGGKPLISWVLEAAISSKVFSKVLISTDCGRIARIARNCGAWVPFIRPPELSSDSAESVDALIHAVEWLLHSKNIEKPKTVCLVQATSPFLSASYLQDAKLKFEIGGFTSMSSMCQVRERPEWMFSLGPGNLAKPLNPDKLSDPSSKLPVYYIENGAMFFIK